MDLDFISVHKQEKKELGQYPAILTSRLVDNPSFIHESMGSYNWCINDEKPLLYYYIVSII